MAFNFVAFAALVVAAQAGIINEAYSSPLSYAGSAVSKIAYSEAPSVSYSSLSSPLALAHAPTFAKVAYSEAPSVSYSSLSAPFALAQSARLSHAAPAYSYAAPEHVSYAAPALQYAAPALQYAAPALQYAAPAYKVASPVAYAAPATKTIIAEPSAPAHYDFGYAVNDPQTGDSKSQQESRRGDTVQGSYSVVDSDGTKRTVDYTADDHNGFNAIVRKEPVAVAVKTVAKVSPVAYAQHAPVAYAQQAPIGYAQHAPVAYAQHGPVAYAQQAPIGYSQHAPVAYAQQAPIGYAQHAPVAYAQHAPLAYAQQAPFAYAQSALKVAGPIGYTAPSIGYSGAQYYH